MREGKASSSQREGVRGTRGRRPAFPAVSAPTCVLGQGRAFPGGPVPSAADRDETEVTPAGRVRPGIPRWALRPRRLLREPPRPLGVGRTQTLARGSQASGKGSRRPAARAAPGAPTAAAHAGQHRPQDSTGRRSSQKGPPARRTDAAAAPSVPPSERSGRPTFTQVLSRNPRSGPAREGAEARGGQGRAGEGRGPREGCGPGRRPEGPRAGEGRGGQRRAGAPGRAGARGGDRRARAQRRAGLTRV